MERTCGEPDSGTILASIYEIPGEPAIVINGVPNVAPSDSSLPHFDITSDIEPKRHPGFGKWLEGREVRKLFGEQYYSGTVVKFDGELGWYRVVYEDGDSEDLEWHELEEILLPLDITAPLKTLALKILKKSERSPHRMARTKLIKRPGLGTKRKSLEGIQGASMSEFKSLRQTNTDLKNPGNTNMKENNL